MTDHTKNTPQKSMRLMSLDALRGFDMFCIIGGGSVLRELMEMPGEGFFHDVIRPHLQHVNWEGFAAWDLIMPLFLFMVGTAMPFSYNKRLTRGDSKVNIYKHAIIRVLILCVFGLMVQGRLLDFDWNRLVLHLNTLHAIALGYIVATVLILHFNIRKQVAITVVLLLFYWAILIFIPVPNHKMVEVEGQGRTWVDTEGYKTGMDTLTSDDNLGIWLDHWVHEKLGLIDVWESRNSSMRLLLIFGFGANVMLGVFAGHLLCSQRSPNTKFCWLFGLAVACLFAGWLWGQWFPIIKRLWTGLFVLYACGWSYLLLSIFYLLIDIWGFRAWAYGFVVIGMNAIAAYMAVGLYDFNNVADVFLHGLYRFMGEWGNIAQTFGGFMVLWLILWWMYRKKTFLKI